MYIYLEFYLNKEKLNIIFIYLTIKLILDNKTDNKSVRFIY